jgi:tetratricopeptide (TPR) repeat protein
MARRDDQRADVEELVALSEKANDDRLRCDALLAQADLYHYIDQTRTNEPAERAREIAQRIGDRVREARALRRLGLIYRQRNQFNSSRQDLELAITYFRQANLFDEALVCLHTLSLVLGDMGEMEAARAACNEAITLSRQLGERRQEAISLRRLAITYFDEMRHQEAMPYAQAALVIHREVGDRNEECHALNVIGILYAWEGKCNESEAYLRQSLALSEEVNSGMSYLMAVENLIHLHFRAEGQYEAGLQFLESLISKNPFPYDEFLNGSLYADKAGLLADLGQYRAALPLMEKLVAVSENIMPTTIFPAYFLGMVGKLHAELGEFDIVHHYLDRLQQYASRSERAADTAALLNFEAYNAWLEGSEANWQRGIEKAQQAIDLLRGTIWAPDLAECLHVLGNLQLALGLKAEALASTEEMMQISRNMPMAFEAYTYTRSRALRANGNLVEADRYLDEACQRVHLVADQTHDPILRQSWLENVRYNRQILAECSPGNMAASKEHE